MSQSQEPQDLVTGGDIAKRLRVTRERVRQLAQRPDFPKPIGRLGQAKVWGWDAVAEWLRADGRVPPVEIYSATDPVARKVWYWVEWGDGKFERTTDYKVALAQAERICVEHDTAIIDRSDKGSGILRATLGLPT